MRTTACLIAFATGLAFSGVSWAGDQSSDADPHAKFTNVTVEELDKWLASKQAVAVDANSDDTRSNKGMVPGAIAISHYRKFDPAKELPAKKDTKLVFYCSNQQCTAAPKAADVAKSAGYTNVLVMRDGIKGWIDAGKPVAKPTKAS